MPITYEPTLGLSQIPVGTDGATANNERNTDNLRIAGRFNTGSFTPGSVLFTSLSGKIASDATGQIHWEGATNRLGLGTNTPTNQLHISSANTVNPQIRLSDTTTGSSATFRATANLLDIDVFQAIVPGSAVLRFFRSTNVGLGVEEGVAGIQIFTGENAGAAVLNATIGGIGMNTAFCLNNGSVGIGPSPVDICAILEISSVTKGVLFPRMSSGQVTAIPSPVAGLVVFDATTEQLRLFRAGSWKTVQTV